MAQHASVGRCRVLRRQHTIPSSLDSKGSQTASRELPRQAAAMAPISPLAIPDLGGFPDEALQRSASIPPGYILVSDTKHGLRACRLQLMCASKENCDAEEQPGELIRYIQLTGMGMSAVACSQGGCAASVQDENTLPGLLLVSYAWKGLCDCI